MASAYNPTKGVADAPRALTTVAYRPKRAVLHPQVALLRAAASGEPVSPHIPVFVGDLRKQIVWHRKSGSGRQGGQRRARIARPFGAI